MIMRIIRVIEDDNVFKHTKMMNFFFLSENSKLSRMSSEKRGKRIYKIRKLSREYSEIIF